MVARERPSRSARNRLSVWVLPVVCGAVLATAGWYLATQLPVRHQIAEDFVIPGVTEPRACGTSPTFTPPHDGTYKFSWATSDGKVGSLYLTAAPIGPGTVLTLYQSSASSGSGNYVTWTGYNYSFNFCGTTGENATVTGTLYYNAPVL